MSDGFILKGGGSIRMKIPIDYHSLPGKLAVFLRKNVAPILIFLTFSGAFVNTIDYCGEYIPSAWAFRISIIISILTIAEIIFVFHIHATDKGNITQETANTLPAEECADSEQSETSEE